MNARRVALLLIVSLAALAAVSAAAWLLIDRDAAPPESAELRTSAPGVATPPPTAFPTAQRAPAPTPVATAAPPAVTRPTAGDAADCQPVPPPIAPERVSDASPTTWTPPPLPGDMVCNFVGGTPWQPTEDLHDGAGAEFVELRARPLLLGSDATKPPSDAEIEDLGSLADAYEGWLAAWPAAVGAWSSDRYIALASPAVLAERDRLFTHPAIDWGPAWPTCSPFTRSDAWLGAAISGDAAVTYSWRRGEAARCTDDATGRDLPTATACVGPLYAVAALWQRNPGGDPPWLVVSETHRDPLHSDGPRRFDQALAAAHWDAVLTLHTAYAQRIASEESRSDYGACEIRATPARAGTAASSAPDQDHPLASLAPAAPSAPPQWTPDASGTRFWLGRPGDPGAVAIVILGGDRVPYDGEQVPAVDPAPGDVREHLEDVGGGFITHCRDLPNEERTCWARAGWLVRDEAQDAPWLGAPSVEKLGSGWDYCRSVDGEDLACWHEGFLPPVGALPGRPAPQPPEVIPAAWRDPLFPGRPFCRRAPADGQLCWLAYDVPDGGIWRPIVPRNALHSFGRLDPAVACRFGADGAGRDRAFCAPTAGEAALIAASPDQQPVYPRPGSLCVRHSTGEACWAPRPDITQHRPAMWHLP